jgi:hypothetical protein
MCERCNAQFARKDTLRRHYEDGCPRRLEFKQHHSTTSKATHYTHNDLDYSASMINNQSNSNDAHISMPTTGVGSQHPHGLPHAHAHAHQHSYEHEGEQLAHPSLPPTSSEARIGSAGRHRSDTDDSDTLLHQQQQLHHNHNHHHNNTLHRAPTSVKIEPAWS